MTLQTRKILWLVTLLVLLAFNVYVGSQSRSWERQARAYAELAGKLEAILSVDRQPGKADLPEEPTLPGSQLSTDLSERAAKVARGYQVDMYQAHLRYLRRRAQELEDHASMAESVSQPAISGLPEPPFTFRVETVSIDGEPVPGVKVRCLHPRPERGELLVDASVRSDEEGIATFTTAKADLVLDRYFWFCLDDANYVGEGDIGHSPIDGDFSVTRRVLPAGRSIVRVEDEEGRAIPGAKLRLSVDRANFPQFDKAAFAGGVSVDTDRDGRAEVAWPEIPTAIAVVAKDHASTFIRNAELSDKKTLVIVLSAGKTLGGRATDEEGRSLSDVAITAKQKMFGDWSETFALSTTTDADGTFEFKGMSPGQWKIFASQDRGKIPYYFEPREVTVARLRKPKAIILAAKPGFQLKGKCLSKQSIALKGRGNRLPFHVAVHVQENDIRWVETEEDGSFTVTGPLESRGSINFLSISGFHSFIKTPRTFFPFFQVNGGVLRFDSVPAGVYDGVEVDYVRKEK